MKQEKRCTVNHHWRRLPSQRNMEDDFCFYKAVHLDNEGFKCHWKLESDKIKENEIQIKFVKEYKQRVRLTLKSKLNGKNKIKAINTWAVAILILRHVLYNEI